ncbi:LysR family transcriptional regulator [Salmonella enterica]|nr:LysR family transcriptional regulator [Salmonella enterica]EJX4474491.1 LysR family transcriptional regulator [Salmonella enterica]EKS4542780.1 LysR family transcriptional regulator [Salmonella enterica]EKS4547779.1 LysR family transcriptional regulator [Salmonella enterica]EKS4821168.1 LysR family transcriptional regulator [Salmonella enterica]
MNLFSSIKLKYFIAVMEEGSVSKACEKINISRTPLSRAISDLEFCLGFELFTRSKNGMIPNQCGIKLYNRVNPLYSELLKIENDLKNEINKTSLRIAITTEIPDSILSYLRNALNKNNINFNMHSIDLVHNDYSALQNFHDIIITEGNEPPTLNVTEFIIFDIFMITSNSFPKIYNDIVSILEEIKNGDGILISTAPFVKIIKNNDTDFKITKISTKKLFLETKAKTKEINKIISSIVDSFKDLNYKDSNNDLYN